MGRSKSVAAIEFAAKNNLFILAISENESVSETEPHLNRLCNVGTIAKIEKISGDAEHGFQIMLRGLVRFKASRIQYHGSFYDSKKLEAMLSILTRNGFKYYITEANQVYSTPFYRPIPSKDYDVQLNISCFKD